MTFRARFIVGFLALFALGGVPLAQPAARADQAGTVQQASGDTRLSRTGFLATPVQKGTMLREGDRLRTGSDGRIELRMSDQAAVTLGPGSDFVIEKYRQEATPGSIGLKLTQGAVRIATGLFSKQQPEGFRLQTPTATLGVRGTEFGVDQAAATQAMTVTVYSGRVVVNNDRGQVEVPTGATLRLTSASSVPLFVDPATGNTRPAPGFEGSSRPPGVTPGTPPPAKRPPPSQSLPPGFSEAPRPAVTDRLVAASNSGRVILRQGSGGTAGLSGPRQIGDDSYESHSVGQASQLY